MSCCNWNVPVLLLKDGELGVARAAGWLGVA